MNEQKNDLLEHVISLAKRRGFIFPGSEIYGGLANSWDYGPLGVELKNNIKQLWWKMFVHQRDDCVGIDAALIMNPKVWEASGHLKEFSDPLVECNVCHDRFRYDAIVQSQLANDDGTYNCPNIIEVSKIKGEKGKDCPGILGEPRQFNLLFKTFIGAIDPVNSIAQAVAALRIGDERYRQPKEAKIRELINEAIASTVYLRPETAQAMFVNFKNVLDTTRKRLPFGIAQIGKAFRNEITPGNFIFRTREFEQMEIEYFVHPSEWEQHFEQWLLQMRRWIEMVGIDTQKIHEVEIPDGERAHYSQRTIDIEFEFPFGQKELYGLAYRGDFDLKNHQQASGQSLEYRDPEGGDAFLPHVIEPTWGVDRTLLAVLLSAYTQEGERTILKLTPRLAPYKIAVFPLLKNKPELVQKARSLYDELRTTLSVAWDDRGNIGKRYYAQDEIGTPWCVTIDFQTLEDDTVTLRHRDTATQERMTVSEIKALKFAENMI